MMTRKRASAIIFFLLIITLTYGANKKKYPVADIPPELLKNAVAVLRTKTVIFKRTDLNSSKKTLHYAITILNKGGEQYGYFIQSYYKYSHIGNIKATVYDKNGKKVKTIDKDEMYDLAIGSMVSLYSDQHAKIIYPQYDNYPFTVEYSCTFSYRESLNIPSWDIYPAYDISVQQEDFTMITPNVMSNDKELGIHYYVNDSSYQLTKNTIKDKTIYSLHIENLKPISSESFTYINDPSTPTVYFAPVGFSIAGYKGTFDNWKTFGEFIAQLNMGRDKLSEESQNRIKKLVKGKSDKREMVEILYKYMQNKMRYVSEQKGIGGWQPIKAQRVDDLSYSDCKGLTNYMKSLLKVVDIPAMYTLVYARKNAAPILSRFPSNQFNHAILCVPITDDTIWLECTSQHTPCGYLGDFTDDRNVLLIDENSGAKLVKTPVYGKDVNKRIRNTKVNLTDYGDCNLQIQTTNSGFFYDDKHGLYLDTRDNQKQKLLKKMHFSTIKLKNFSFKEEKSSIPVIHSNIQLEVTGYAIKSGNRLLFAPYLFSQDNSYHFRQKTRRSPIIIRRSYITVDTIVYHIPQGFAASKQTEKTVTTKFGTYRSETQKHSDEIIYTRELSINKGTYPPSDWTQIVDFYKEIDKLDNSKIVLLKR